MPAVDKFAGYQSGLQTPARHSFAVTPDDANELPFVTRGLFVGGAGNVKVRLADDAVAVTFTGVVAGSLLPIRVRQVYATGTTATNMVGTY